jgi:hypothetical protein
VGFFNHQAVAEIDAIDNSLRDTEPVSSIINSLEHPMTQISAVPTTLDWETHPDLSQLTTVKIPHRNLILAGVAEKCAHCGLALTDAVSVQRSMGPICYGKGYSEDPVDGDEIQAMIELSAWPELVEFLTVHYKPLGLRGLINGLVRVCCLNRPRSNGTGNREVFNSCCNAIEYPGHRKMAARLRNTLAVCSIKDSEKRPGHLEIWVKKSEYKWSWSQDTRNYLNGSFFDRQAKALVIPITKPDGNPVYSKMTENGLCLSNRQALWNLLCKHYHGMVLKKDGEGHLIKKAK